MEQQVRRKARNPLGRVFIKGTATAEASTQEDGVSVKAWIGAQPEDQGEEAQSSLLDNVRGGKLFRVSKEQTSGTVSLALGAQSSAPGDQSPRHPQTDRAGSILSVSAKVDDRSVSLSRGGRYESSKLEGGDWHTYGDSIYSALSPNIPGDNLLYPLSIGVNYAGNWSSWGIGYNISPSWTTPGFETVDGTNNLSAWGKTKFGTPVRSISNFYGIPYYHGLEGEPTGAETFDTTYTAVDNGDGATAKAYYHLTLHDPVEKDGADDISTYHVTFPMSNGSDITYIGENSATESERPLVEVGHSTQYGYGITATVGIEGVASLLGLSAEASAQAESTTTITATTTKRVPHLTEGQKVYLVADHPFQRTHVRFWKYDEGGKVKRMFRISDEGVTPPAELEVRHEAFEDTAAQATYDWSRIYEEHELDIGNLPHTPAPELPYDYSGGSS